MAKSEITPWAAAAKAIRKDLKQAFPDTKFKVTSCSFSMGDAVDVRWTNGPTVEEVDRITQKYQYGRFDGMTDSYSMNNTREDIPQAKYVQCQRGKS